MKQNIKLIALVLSLAVALPAMAQDITNGRWQFHAIFSSDNPIACYDAGTRVFYQAGSSLFCYDKATQENEALNSLNRLNDSGVQGVYYNAEEQYIVVTYQNANMDVLLRNDDVINIPAQLDYQGASECRPHRRQDH